MRLTADQRELIAAVAVASARVQVEQARLERAIEAAWRAGANGRQIGLACGLSRETIRRRYAANHNQPLEGS